MGYLITVVRLTNGWIENGFMKAQKDTNMERTFRKRVHIEASSNFIDKRATDGLIMGRMMAGGDMIRCRN